MQIAKVNLLRVFIYNLFLFSSCHKNLYKTRSVELQYLIFEKSNKVENEKKS